MSAQLNLPVPLDEQEAADKPGWEMKTLKPWHKQVASMLAQGIGADDIAVIVDCTPTYVYMLARQPKIREHIRDMCQAADLQLEGLFVEGVKAIGEVLVNGNSKEKIQAARLQMEATRRIGPRHSDTPVQEDTVNRLSRLAERLLQLQTNATSVPSATHIIEGEVITNVRINEACPPEDSGVGQQWCDEPAQASGDGSGYPG